ncbi:MAG: 4-hydroxythreonine-4-phosphate dehydrogenase PdxA [Candidatus Omnitrophica bacterium]|nr:4-hydroxythreonine-4-phosphate dehydrogenase PdxA [Candidatus Omnitrophota bacterium]
MLRLRRKIRVGLTMGDPSGIGPTIIAKALPKVKGLAEFVVVGDKWVFDKVISCKSQVTLRLRSGQASHKFIDLNNVNHRKFAFGKVRAEYGRASMEYLDKAMELIKKKEIDCLVTCPISKEAINLAGFKFSGHTEYLERRARAADTVMMLLNKDLKFSLVTRHIPLEDVCRALTKDKLSRNIYITSRALKELFLINRPRIAIAGLNPHASDNGLIGCQENRIIKPALRKFKKNKARLYGPLSADVAIYQAKEKKFDCVIAMYHDQALIALKLCGNDTGVNLTLGLPFIRTSPLHGTAFDIAATGRARPASLIAAIKLAIRCALNLKYTDVHG